MDVKRAKELSERYAKIVNGRKLRSMIRFINKRIKRECKLGVNSYSYMGYELNMEVRAKIVEHYSSKGFETELTGYRIFIKW